jgi:hypothetical protein
MRKVTPVMDRIVARSKEVPCLIKGLHPLCWVWTGNLSKGYGIAMVGSRTDGTRRFLSMHRVAYAELRDEIPEGLDLDHLCRNRACWNPWHTEPVTRAVNLARGLGSVVNGAWQRAKTRCPAGHAYDDINTYDRPDGSRGCRACIRKRGREFARAKRAGLR